MAVKQISYIGRGTVYLEPRGEANAKLTPIGNISEFSISIEEDTKTMIDYMNPGGGELDRVTRITGVSASMTCYNLSPENIAVAVFGSIDALEGGAVTDEEHTAYKNSLVVLDKLFDKSQTITVTDESGTTPYEPNVDYEVTNAGIYILESGSITDGSTIKVSYTAYATDVIQALTELGKEYKLVFDGLNEARSGEPVVGIFHRVKFSPTKGLGFITDDFGTLDFDLAVLADSSISGTGVSKYFIIRRKDV